MAERHRSNDGQKETEEFLKDDGTNGVPGAHGNGDDFPNRATGVSEVRKTAEEIAPTEDTGEEGDHD